MAVRHFKKKPTSIDNPQESVIEVETKPVVPEPSVEAHSESETSGTSDEDVDDTSSSDDEENVVIFQRPQFLGKKKRQKSDDSTQNSEAKRRDTLNERIKQENRASEARETLESQLKSSFGTNDELLRRIMVLDDNDTVDPEHERQEWLNRCATRSKLRRDALLAKQLEMEEYEANKLKMGKSSDDVDKSETAPGDRKPGANKTTYSKNFNQKWRPSKAQNPEFSQSTIVSGQQEETEYSCI